MKKRRMATFVTLMAILISCFGGISTNANALDNTIEPIADEVIIMPRYM